VRPKSRRAPRTTSTWYAAPKAEHLEPVDDLMKTLISQNGAVSSGHEYLGKVQGHWIAVPATVGTLTLPPCSRIDLSRSLLTYLCQRSSVEQTVAASYGHDILPFSGLHDFKTWADEAPPKGTIYHYPPARRCGDGHPL